MPHHRKPARMLISAALAATTALTGPTFALADQQRVLRMAQADDLVAPEADTGDAAPPESAAPESSGEPEPRGAPPAAEEGAGETPSQAEPEAPAAPDPVEVAPSVSEEPPPRASEEGGSASEEPQRRERRNSDGQGEGAAEQPPAEPDAVPSRRQRQGEQAAEPTAPSAPAEPAEPSPPATPESSPVPPVPPAASDAAPGAGTPATPDASAPAVAPAPAPQGEVQTPPAAAEPATPATPAVPAPAAPPSAPDASTTPPRNAPPASDAVPAPATPAPAPDESSAGGSAPAPGGEAPAAAVVPAPPPAAANPQPVPLDVQNAPVEAGRIDQSDARVQTLQQPVDVQPITRERGERISDEPRYELPPDAQVVRREGGRQILSLGAAAVAGAVAGAAAGYYIRSNDEERLGVDAAENYTERLPRGRTRETIVRPNGVQVVTITNRYGDVIQRSRVMPDGREVVLFYDPYSEDNQRPAYYEDPGRDLPPIRVDIPEDEYVVDIDEPDEGVYYDTLVAPPVETVERIYSVDEVRRSGRIREKVRRIDLATVNFDFGSASIAQNQVPKLEALAEAVQRIVKDNPSESFLIEGHTDAVGSGEANLVLSDQRAEAVASALTRYFEVPAENLVTQGYGEQELKVKTQGESRENRRVTVRRITALVKPIETSGR